MEQIGSNYNFKEMTTQDVLSVQGRQIKDSALFTIVEYQRETGTAQRYITS